MAWKVYWNIPLEFGFCVPGSLRLRQFLQRHVPLVLMYLEHV